MKEIKIVIGGNFGDEGKGLMTDYFAAEAAAAGRKAIVVCSNGGAQRGHTVTIPTLIRHVFHHFGSGTLAGADTWLPRFFIVNPMIFMSEYEELGRKGTHVFADPECPVTTPYDMVTNQILEESRGAGRHGSCGVGIWETLLRAGLTLGEMSALSDEELQNYLAGTCRQQMERRLRQRGIGEIPGKWREILEDQGLVLNYIEDFREMCRLIRFGDVEVLEDYDTVIFEAGQGLLLDRCRKEYGCHTTPSNTGLRNPAALLREMAGGMPCEMDVEVCYVTRTYLTRHGAGPFAEECGKEFINPRMVDLTNVPNPHQGTLRYGKLDTRVFLRRVREDYDSECLPAGMNRRMTIAVTHVNECFHTVVGYGTYISRGETRDSVWKGEAMMTA